MPENAEKVAQRSGQHKEMPYRMMVRQPFPEIENAAERVQQSTEQQPHKPRRAQRFGQRDYGDNRNPSHRDVCRRRQIMAFAGVPHLDKHSRKHGGPFDAKYGPPHDGMPIRTERHKAERSIRAGDEKIYRHVVEDVQYILRRLVGDGMIRAGDRIKEYDRGAENAP